jgi:hypothetical protein
MTTIKIIKLTKSMRKTKAPNEYRLAKLSEFITHIEKGFRPEKYHRYYCENYLVDKSRFSALYGDWDGGYRLSIFGIHSDVDDGCVFGVYVKKEKKK